MNRKIKKWLKGIGIALLTPVILLVILFVLLYIPPVQNVLKNQFVKYASHKTGMQITIDKLRLSFPLDLALYKASVVSHRDTLFVADKLIVDLGLRRLLHGEVRVDGITLSKASVNSSRLIKGIRIRGVLGELFLASDKVDFPREEAYISRAVLRNSGLKLSVIDTTTTPKEKPSEPLHWKLLFERLQLRNVSFHMDQPFDSIKMLTRVDEAVLRGGKIDFLKKIYNVRRLSVVKGIFNYDSGKQKPSKGFDPSHIAMRDLFVSVDSFHNRGRELRAAIKRISMSERSGIYICSLTGNILADNRAIKLPEIIVNTPHSEAILNVKADWLLFKNSNEGSFSSSVVANIGKQDVLLFVGGLPKEFNDAYPFRVITFRALAEGNMKDVRLSRLTATLPGSFSLASTAHLKDLSDRVNRSGRIDFRLDAKDLGFLATLIKKTSNGSVRVPKDINLQGLLAMKGTRYKAGVILNEGGGEVKADAEYNGMQKTYTAKASINKFQVGHFLPKQQFHSLTASFDMIGEGTDIFSPRTKITGGVKVDQLQYGKTVVTGASAKVDLQSSLLKAALTSENNVLQMEANLAATLQKKLVKADLSMNVRHIDLKRLGFIPRSLRKPTPFTLIASTDKAHTSLELHSGDLAVSLNSTAPLMNFVKETSAFSSLLIKQMEQKRLNQQELRKKMPSAKLVFSAGRKNPFSEYLALSKIYFKSASADLQTSRLDGVQGHLLVNSFETDSVFLDTIRLAIRQDTAAIRLHAGIINNAANKQYVFQAYADGTVGNDNAELMLRYLNAKGQLGTNFGVRAKVEENGFAFNVFPDNPLLLFRPFSVNKDNRIFIGNDKRITANLDLQDKSGMGLFIHSMENPEAQQDLIAELRNLDLKEVVNSLPYLPDVGGIFSAKAEYLQKEDRFQVFADGGVKNFMYTNQLVGDMNLKATYLPAAENEHQLTAALGYNGKEVLTADGVYKAAQEELMNVHANLKALPLSIANAFIPDQMVRLSGALNGFVTLEGKTAAPHINGEVTADSASAFIAQAGARLRMDNKTIKIVDNKLTFDNYSIYAAGKNPLTVAGNIDFKDLQQMRADLKLSAKNYQLFNATRTKESLVYGKLFADINSTVRGPLDALIMRGNMRILGTTDATYVLKDSPLTVQDRLGDMVSFVNFNDSLPVPKEKQKPLSLGGLDMLINIQIESAVRLKADLSPDRENRIELEGGGNLTLQYTPQENLLLYGRYTFSDGLLKYTLPVIPLKSFAIQNGSYVEWSGNMMNPKVSLKAVERVRASVANENQSTRQVNFDVSVSIKNTLKDLGMVFNLEAPEDMTVQNQLSAMSDEERSKQAITMLATGMYMPNGFTSAGSSGGINMGSALNSFLQSEISSIAGSALQKVDITFGMESYEDTGTKGTGKRTDYSYRFAKRFYNDRIRIVIGGKISTGETADEKQSFIDNVSLEYRLDSGGTRYVRLFHNKNYQSLLEGEITETGAGIVLRKKMRRFGELFIFKNKENKKESK